MENKKLFLISGPCVIEDWETTVQIAEEVKRICDKLGITYIFKGSYKKANRTKLGSFTGLNKMTSLEYLKQIGIQFDIDTITDVHESDECEFVSEYVDYLQIPAFLCRQTDLLLAAGQYAKKGVNIKKGQFMSPEAMKFQQEKVMSVIEKPNTIYPHGSKHVWITERGTTFGYNDLVVDMTSVPRIKKFGTFIMDCTHSVQIPNQTAGVTGGNPEMIETIALSSIAAGADGLFIEVHPEPHTSGSDAGSILQLDKLESILTKCVKIRKSLES
jgi:2-dehydro-3-deoxyphosphooctonate aldolase (KDO 8-P synthase)